MDKTPLNATSYKEGGAFKVSYTKYNKTDSKTILDATDDAATHNWGQGWRMPTISEIRELVNGCDWEWTTYKGKKGYMVSGRRPGYTNTAIFLPANGSMSHDDHDIEVNPLNRYYGFAVRAVKARSDF